MKVCAFQLTHHLLHTSIHGHHLQPRKLLPPPTKLSPPPRSAAANARSLRKPYRFINPRPSNKENEPFEKSSPGELPRWLLLGGLSFALALLIQGFDGQREAMAFGPEGPLVEEFWDNMRRYGLYFLTVSTGAIYTIMLPIIELLKSPITAILIIVLFAGSLYLLSQVLSAMICSQPKKEVRSRMSRFVNAVFGCLRADRMFVYV